MMTKFVNAPLVLRVYLLPEDESHCVPQVYIINAELYFMETTLKLNVALVVAISTIEIYAKKYLGHFKNISSTF